MQRRPHVIPSVLFALSIAAFAAAAPAEVRAAAAGDPSVTPTRARASGAKQRAPGAAGPCKSLDTFTSSAAPAIQKHGCAGCHGGGSAPATAAFDLRSIGKDNAAACVQVLAKVNLADKPGSAIIGVSAGTVPHKGGKVADPQAFKDSLLGWIKNE